MSLQVWLPLTGDLHNQGLSDVTITNSDVTVNNNGKIGKCIKTGNSAIDLRYDGAAINTESMSIGGWFKFNQSEIATRLQSATINETRHSPVGNIIGNNGYGGIGLIWEANNMYQDGTLNELHVFGNMRSSTLGYRSTGTYTISFDQWTHIFLIFDKSSNTESLYVNGVRVSQITSLASFSDASTRNMQINAALVCGGNGPGVNIPFYCNDVRIYNHALTEKEIKEISRGLVLHYPLNDKMVESTINLLPVSLQNFTVNGTNNPASYSYSTTEHGQYTLSCDIKREITDEVWTYPRITLRAAYTSGTFTTVQDYNMPKDGQWHHYELTVTTDTSKTLSAIGGWILDHSSASSKYATVSNAQLEFKGYATPYTSSSRISSEQVVHDISGYQNNGTVTGELSTSNDTVRYKTATYFNGSSSISAASLPNEVKTISLWINISEIPTTNSLVFIDTNSRLALGFYSSGTLFIVSSVDNSANVVAINNKITINKWHHIVVIKTGQQSRQVYIDGSLLSNAGVSNNYYIHQGNNFMLGQRLYGSTTNYFTGKMSDFRAYTTALSADDIKELYEMGVES